MNLAQMEAAKKNMVIWLSESALNSGENRGRSNAPETLNSMI